MLQEDPGRGAAVRAQGSGGQEGAPAANRRAGGGTSQAEDQRGQNH